MSDILGFFGEDMTAASNERTTITNIGGIETPTIADVGTFECLYWEGSSAEAFVSERFRDRTSAAIGVYPGTDIEENDIIHVEGEKYTALKPQDIGAADQVIIVALEVFG